MASWSIDAELSNPVDFRLVHISFVTMFWQSSLLDRTIGWLDDHLYDVVSFDAASWTSDRVMLDDMSRRLDFADPYGHNLSSFEDCMRDVASGEYGWNPRSTGLVIVLRAFDAFVEVDRSTAQHLLDILAKRARSGILIGNRIICLVQTNDPQLSFEPIGALRVEWNDAEWPASKRGL